MVTATAAAVPVALSVLTPRNRGRDVAICVGQMWAYLATYKMPNDDPEALERRVMIDYPISFDRRVGLGELPTVRLQRMLGVPGQVRPLEQVLVWAHWVWFAFPHGTAAYILARHPKRFPRAALLTYSVFDLGLIGYWALPTAPPWYAALEGRLHHDDGPKLRRMMVEHGQRVWGERWDSLYGVLGGNPLAAMPSLHFATSLMAAHLLSELGPTEAAIGWTYVVVLGFALVYLGEHYVIDLLAGAALTEGIRAAADPLAPLFAAISDKLAELEGRAR
ncbi:MAG TPA: phosphatase PAP2 family protein [Baekduia sp.]|nr:phosphatase PAP2 family protein [Baekduia sp.]